MNFSAQNLDELEEMFENHGELKEPSPYNNFQKINFFCLYLNSNLRESWLLQHKIYMVLMKTKVDGSLFFLLKKYNFITRYYMS